MLLDCIKSMCNLTLGVLLLNMTILVYDILNNLAYHSLGKKSQLKLEIDGDW